MKSKRARHNARRLAAKDNDNPNKSDTMADTQHVDPHKAIIANGITVAIVPDKEHPDYREEERISPSSATPDGYVDSRGNTNPYLQGEEAWFEGKRCDESPYEAATDNDEDWRAGWRNAAEAYT